MVPLDGFQAGRATALLHTVRKRSIFLASHVNSFGLIPISMRRGVTAQVERNLGRIGQVRTNRRPTGDTGTFLSRL